VPLIFEGTQEVVIPGGEEDAVRATVPVKPPVE
jgi:hypothetical protein